MFRNSFVIVVLYFHFAAWFQGCCKPESIFERMFEFMLLLCCYCDKAVETLLKSYSDSIFVS